MFDGQRKNWNWVRYVWGRLFSSRQDLTPSVILQMHKFPRSHKYSLFTRRRDILVAGRVLRCRMSGLCDSEPLTWIAEHLTGDSLCLVRSLPAVRSGHLTSRLLPFTCQPWGPEILPHGAEGREMGCEREHTTVNRSPVSQLPYQCWATRHHDRSPAPRNPRLWP